MLTWISLSKSSDIRGLNLEIYFLAYQIVPRRICIYIEDVGLATRVLGAK